MSLSEMFTSLIFILCSVIAPLLTDEEALLPAPQNISILSTNMKHFLTWSPVTVPGETVRYSVEFQGEYERDYANEIWIPISECSLIIVTQCNVTEDISATVPYNLRVRANLGSRGSKWSTLKVLFNRITTFLTPPVMEVSADGYHLLVKLEDLGPAFQFHIFYWRKGQERVHKKTVKEISSVVHLDTIEAGAEYCVKAQTYVEAINRSSNFSQTQCVHGPDGGRSIWMTTALVSFVGFVVGVLALPFLAWKMSQIFQYSCCPVVVLPDTLKVTESPAMLIHCRSEETECCDVAVHVIPPEEILRLWIQDAL
ncbi:interleukin-20 receptor subunit beta [Terrapene carolina triunguis]|uniref:interleukin-20 receptor subunit beta n=1 Tax=Terrapene triunguis TaxID=2587831 RepID=UPI000E776D25|nr:interleukin-20 receptor subunit beta [Terrapene carolina triunguis]